MNKTVLLSHNKKKVTVHIDGIPNRAFTGVLDASKLRDQVVVLHNDKGEPLHFPADRVSMLVWARP